MARKRMIDPDFWTDEALGQVDRTTRLLFMGLISQADDDGRLRGNPALIRSQVFPYDEDITASDVDCALDLLQHHGLILRYSVDGQSYLWLRNFAKHQTINKKTDSKLPPPESADTSHEMSAPAPLPEDYGSPTAPLPPKRREEKRREENTATPTAPRTNLRVVDEIFEAIIEVCYGKPPDELTRDERGRANKATAQLREVNATAGEIKARARAYRKRSPGFPLTPQTLTKAWTDLGAPAVVENNLERYPEWKSSYAET